MTESISLENFIGKNGTRETHSLTLEKHTEEGTLIKKDYQKCGRKRCDVCTNGRGHIGPYYWRVKSVKVGHRNYRQIWKFIGKTPR